MDEAALQNALRALLVERGCTEIDMHSGTDAVAVVCRREGVGWRHRQRVGCGRSMGDIYADIITAADATFPPQEAISTASAPPATEPPSTGQTSSSDEDVKREGPSRG